MTKSIKYVAEPYQRIATKHIVERKEVVLCGGAGLFLEMGLGKTVATLDAFVKLRKRGEVRKMLVIAPLRVAEHTWPAEIRKWTFSRHLKVAVCTGDEKGRIKALNSNADVFCINRENVPWLCGYYGRRKWPFHMVCIDELSSFKSSDSARWEALHAKRPLFLRTVGLTGTPAPNGMIDLWSQVYLLDKGERLGKKLYDFKNRFFVEKHITNDIKRPVLRDGTENEIYGLIEDICISMKTEDWLKLPEKIERVHTVSMSEKDFDRYEKFEEEAFMEFLEDEDGAEITAANAAALVGKLLQFANGAVYSNPERTEFKEIHNAKMDELEDILEAAQGKPILCFYKFKHDVDRILNSKRFKKYKPHKLQKGKEGIKDIDKWNRGELPFLLAHPASAGHGLNMQEGNTQIVWFGLPWSLELFQQANARLYRKGRKFPVTIHVISVEGTMDEKVAISLILKEAGQEMLMQALNVKREKYLHKFVVKNSKYSQAA